MSMSVIVRVAVVVPVIVMVRSLDSRSVGLYLETLLSGCRHLGSVVLVHRAVLVDVSAVVVTLITITSTSCKGQQGCSHNHYLFHIHSDFVDLLN